MDCGHRGESIHSLLDGDISEKELERLNEHIAECPECAAELDALKKQTEFCKSLISGGHTPVDMQKIKGECGRRRFAKRRRVVSAICASAAAVVVCVLSVSYFAANGAKYDNAASTASGYESEAPAAEDCAPAEAPVPVPDCEAPAAAEAKKSDEFGAAFDAEAEEAVFDDAADGAVPAERAVNGYSGGADSGTGQAVSVEKDAAERLMRRLKGAGVSVTEYEGSFSIYIDELNMETVNSAFAEEGISADIFAGCEIYVSIE